MSKAETLRSSMRSDVSQDLEGISRGLKETLKAHQQIAEEVKRFEEQTPESIERLSACLEPLVEVILLSRNSADTGLRVFNSIRHHELTIGRAAFTSGSLSGISMLPDTSIRNTRFWGGRSALGISAA